MPSASFSGCLTRLCVRPAAAGHKNKQNNSQNHLTDKNRNAFHYFFLLKITCACATPVPAFAPVPARPTGAGKKARGCRQRTIRSHLPLRECRQHKKNSDYLFIIAAAEIVVNPLINFLASISRIFGICRASNSRASNNTTAQCRLKNLDCVCR